MLNVEIVGRRSSVTGRNACRRII